MAFGGGVGETARLLAQLDLRDNFSRGAGTALASVGRLETGLGRMGRGAGQVASGLDRLGTRAALAAAGGLTAVVTTAASFEQAFTGIEKTVDAGGKSAADNIRIFAELEEQFRSMARTIPVSFEELAGIGEAGGALGIAKEDLLDFTDVVARLAVSTNLSSDQAATALGQLGNVLHLSGDDFRDFADSLVALGNAGASTESQIVEIAARFGAAGNAAGLSKEEILALSSAVASMGIEVEAGGSALSRVFNAVATNIGTSSDKAVAFAKVLNLSAGEFKRAWERDALGTFQNFLRELSKLDQFEASKVLKDIGITNTRDVNTVRLMGQNVKFVGEQLRISEQAQGDLNKESQKFFDTTQGQWQTLRNNIRDAGVTIGNELLPLTKELLEDFTGFLNQPGTRRDLKAFGQDLASGIREVVEELKGADFSGLIDGMKLAGEIASRAFSLFRSLPPEIQALAVTAIAANKLSGGAIGQIAKGLVNIGTGGFLLGRTPATAMWVRTVGLPLGGAPVAAGGLGGFAGNIVKAIPWVLVAGLVADQLDIGPFQSEGPPKRLDRGGDFGKPAPVRITNPEDIRDNRGSKTEAGTGTTPFGQFRPTNTGGLPVTVTNASALTEWDERNFNQAAADASRQSAQMAQLTLEQRLIKDSSFKSQIDQKEFLRILRRTSEFGRRGVGTTIEQGPKTGRDPLGDAFVALVKRVPKDMLTGEVYREVANHIVALEEVQKGLIAEGNTEAARHAQRNIDKLAALIGTVDRTRPLLERQASNISALAGVTREARDATRSGFQSSNAHLGVIARKDLSVTANLYTTLAVNLNASLIEERILQQRLSAGTGPQERF